MIITIDGPSGTGKSTVAKRVAERLGFAFFDTGAMYRAVAFCMKKEQISIDDKRAIENLLGNFSFRICNEKGKKRYFSGDEEITDEIRTREITSLVSAVAALPIVREKIWDIQRCFGEKESAVFEGRDMGTTVFPNANLKIFLSARPQVRAERRLKEFQEMQLMDPGLSQDQILKEILARDEADSTRTLSPLKKAEDAIEIDTSDLSIEEVVDKILSLKEQRCLFNRKKPSWFYSFVIASVAIFLKLFYSHKIYGQNHIRPGAAILASNHVSYLDPPIISVSCPGEVFFLARKTLFKGWFGKMIFSLNARPVNSGAANLQLFRDISHLLEEGKKVILFPEGTRSPDGNLGEIKSGIFLLFQRTHCAIQPGYIAGSFSIWGRQKKLPKLSGRTACIFGSPILWDRYEGMAKKEAEEKFIHDLRASILSLKKWYEEGAKGTPP
jgi:cytidylate kinase